MDDDARLSTFRIPALGKEATTLALGCGMFGEVAWGGQDDAASRAVLDAAWRCGIRFLDTAAKYGQGRSEEIVGRFLAEGGPTRRASVTLASKGLVRELSPAAILQALDESLCRLGVEHIDLYYVHWPRPGQDMRPWMEGLERARAEAQIGAIGVSNFNVAQMEQLAEVGRIDAHELCYSLLWREAERETLPYCHEQGIAVVAYGALAQGALTGRFGRDYRPRPDAYRASTIFFQEGVWPHVCQAVQELQALARKVGRPLAHLALRWVMQRPGVTAAVVGASRPEQVAQNAAAMRSEIPQEVFERMTAISDRAMAHIPDVGTIYYPLLRRRRPDVAAYLAKQGD